MIKRFKIPVFGVAAVIGVSCAAIWFIAILMADQRGGHHSNRAFAGPAAVASFALSAWLTMRMTRTPLPIRVIVFLLAFFTGYAAIGLGMILLNAVMQN